MSHTPMNIDFVNEVFSNEYAIHLFEGWKAYGDIWAYSYQPVDIDA